MTLEPPEFALSEDALRQAIKPNTRAVVACTPSNPSGKMMTVPELEEVLWLSDRVVALVRGEVCPVPAEADRALLGAIMLGRNGAE